MARRLTAALTPDAEAGGYVARCLELPVTTQGETVEEALAHLREAVELYVETAGDAAVAVTPLIAPLDVAV
jgi:predicted RNase H-like HicB family nuclease